MRTYRILVTVCALVALASAWTVALAQRPHDERGLLSEPATCCHYGSDCPGWNDICCWTGSECEYPPMIYRCVTDPKLCK